MTNTSRGFGPLAVIIMGVSGSGKSTLARELSVATGSPFLEGDTFHTPEAIAKMAAGIPLNDDDRGPWLERLGHAIAADVTTRGFTIATCSALKRIYRDRLRQTIAAPIKFVLLEGEREMLARRLANRVGHYMPASLLSSQFDTLERPSPDEHVLILDAALSPSAACSKVLAWTAEV
jgi:gluconokinase